MPAAASGDPSLPDASSLMQPPASPPSVDLSLRLPDSQTPVPFRGSWEATPAAATKLQTQQLQVSGTSHPGSSSQQAHSSQQAGRGSQNGGRGSGSSGASPGGQMERSSPFSSDGGAIAVAMAAAAAAAVAGSAVPSPIPSSGNSMPDLLLSQRSSEQAPQRSGASTAQGSGMQGPCREDASGTPTSLAAGRRHAAAAAAAVGQGAAQGLSGIHTVLSRGASSGGGSGAQEPPLLLLGLAAQYTVSCRYMRHGAPLLCLWAQSERG